MLVYNHLWAFFHMVCLVITASGIALADTPHCYAPDLAALRAFARNFPSVNFSDWEASDDCCDWGPSVTCSSSSAPSTSAPSSALPALRVTELRLARLSSAAPSNPAVLNSHLSLCSLSALSTLELSRGWLSGPIPHCIGTNLSNLVYLDLSSNALTGSIPPSFARLQSLQLFSLSDNSLSGPFPPFLSNGLLSNLTLISLSSNYFSGFLSAAFTAPSLYSLSLQSNSFSGPIPAFNNCPALAVVDLSRNSLSGTISSHLFAPALSSLSISYNALYGGVPADLSRHLPFLANLELSNNLLNDSIPESLCQLTQLQHLDLSSNALSGRLFASPDVCGQPRFLNLSILVLSHNSLVGAFPSCLGYLSKMQTLDLSYNSFKGGIPSSWGNLTSLMVLQLSGNTLGFNSPSAPLLPPWIFQLPSLTSIALSSAGLHTESFACSSLHNSLFNTSLQEYGDLDISYNNLSVDVLRCFQESLTSLSTLNMSGNPLALNLNNPKEVKLLPQVSYILDFSSCELSGGLTDLLLDRLMGISELHLPMNQLVGRIPAQLGNLSSLWFLDLSNNFFNSFDAGFNLGSLLSIDFSHNALAGSLSSLLMDLTNNTPANSPEVTCVRKISDLDLSHNFLTGPIPPSVGQCIERRIKLNNNQLAGFIPSFLFDNTTHGPEILSLGNNQLRGKASPSIGKLKHLKLLDLGGNILQGNLEATIFFNASDRFLDLRILVLGYNHFTGSIIPVSFGRFMPALQVLDLSNNQLTGSIPRSFRALPAFRVVENPQEGSLLAKRGILYEDVRINVKGSTLDYSHILLLLTSIDLSGNNLSGPIPTGLGELSGLVFLNFSRNKLSGQIPSDLGMLGEQLESLDLSFNELVGSIPSSFRNLTKLADFNVSYNKGLHGSIPSNPQFERADSYIGDPDLCGEYIFHPCASDNSSSYMQPGITQDGDGRSAGKQQSSVSAWIDEWISVPGLCLGIVVGFAGTLWILIYL